MKTHIRYKNRKLLTFLAILSFTLIGCGGGGTNWGIDHADALPVPVCDTAASDGGLSTATLVEQGGIVRPLTDDTQVRVWHFQNSEEFVCTLQGEAVVEQPATGGN